MKRRIFHLLMILSLACCEACVVSWAWSYHGTFDDFKWSRSYDANSQRTDTRFFRSMGGLILFTSEHSTDRRGDPSDESARAEQDRSAWWAQASFHDGVLASEYRIGRLRQMDFHKLDERNRQGRSWELGPISVGRYWMRGYPERAGWSLRVPWFAPTAATAALPAFWLLMTGARFMRYRRRAAQGLCRRCGYDMRATPGRCPECGAVASTIADAYA